MVDVADEAVGVARLAILELRHPRRVDALARTAQEDFGRIRRGDSLERALVGVRPPVDRWGHQLVRPWRSRLRVLDHEAYGRERRLDVPRLLLLGGRSG